jgi:hypothetical protein
MDDGNMARALRGEGAPDREMVSSIDALLHQSKAYRSSEAFRDMVEFMGHFRDYAPYNNMLVRLQNPGCSFFATASDWRKRFGRSLTEDARPMLILAPMRPVMLVYDLDQTEGKALPQELTQFAQFDGTWREEWMTRLLENAQRLGIRIDFKLLRIAVHDGLDGPSRFGVHRTPAG